MAAIAVHANPEALASAVAELLTVRIEDAVSSRGIAFVALTGGDTPQRLYEQLADPALPWRRRVSWPRIHVAWSDERSVPPSHPNSNFRMTERALLRHVGVPAAQIHRIHGEISDVTAAARAYGNELRDAIGPAARDVLFDVTLLGIGEEAHIASIFPDSPLFDRLPDDSLAAGVWVPQLHTWRITLTPGAILASKSIVVIASGRAKAQAIHAALEGSFDPLRWPAQILRDADDRVTWAMDEDAAALLSPDVRRG